MTKKMDPNSLVGVLARLRKDESGNAIALLAAAVVPVLGLVGGGVDMSRIYLAQTRLQAACDAGSLMGRKVMGSGAWADNSNKANTEAERAFVANFKSGSFGTGLVQKAFTESSGKVSGTASVIVPMTIMQVFGTQQYTVRSKCSAEMRIPNSDVMFVLDTTGSMDDAANNQTITSTNPSKISELKVATKCFYELLTQKNIDDVSYTKCGETADPSPTSSNTSQIRFGFVPYSISVNAGRLLPLDYMANQWYYQTRKANYINDPDYDYMLGDVGQLTQQGSPTTSISTGSWDYVGHNVTIGGVLYLETVESTKKGLDCTKVSHPDTQTGGAITNGPYATNTPTPVYPATSITADYEKTVSSGTTEYNYSPDKSKVKDNTKCYLISRNLGPTTTTKYKGNRPVTWISRQVFNNWTYDRIQVNVSGLKNASNNSYNPSLSLPIGSQGANIDIAWDGCILERQTQKNVSTWDTSITSQQKDMAIDLVPSVSDTTTLWGPRIKDVLYARTSGGSWTTNAVTTTADMGRPSSGDGVACPSPSKLLSVWSPTNYKNYINSMTTGGFTFNDIGMLWGARLMSPTGIFAANNAVANDNVQRHMIFMTDGNTNANYQALSAYNVPWFDRLQTTNAPSTSDLNTLTDNRMLALCTAVKNMNITLWVVSYGADVNSTTNDRLKTCATSPTQHFFQYQPGVSLTSQFKQIAGKIAALRLTT